MRTLSLLFVLAMVFTSCQSGAENSEAEQTNEAAAPEQEAPALKYTLSAFSPSQAYPDAAIEGVTYENGKFNFAVGGETYELGAQTPDAEAKMCANSGKGQHIHLIIDNAPYAAKYEAAFDYEIEDGEHYMLAFLSRSYHESIKTEAAHVAKKITVEGNSFKGMEDIAEPILFYSRPKGTYVGAANTDKVMLDFYLNNVPGFGTDHMVKATINGEDHMVDTWQPYYIEGLPMGENTVTLTLVDAEGKAVDTPMNPVTRTFTLQKDPVE